MTEDFGIGVSLLMSKTQVLEALGEPDDASAGGRAWEYRLSEASETSAVWPPDSVVVIFDHSVVSSVMIEAWWGSARAREVRIGNKALPHVSRCDIERMFPGGKWVRTSTHDRDDVYRLVLEGPFLAGAPRSHLPEVSVSKVVLGVSWHGDSIDGITVWVHITET